MHIHIYIFVYKYIPALYARTQNINIMLGGFNSETWKAEDNQLQQLKDKKMTGL